MGNTCGGDLKDEEDKSGDKDGDTQLLTKSKNIYDEIFIENTKEKIKNKHLINENCDEIKETDIGKWYKNYSNELNKILPVYIIFNTNYDLDNINVFDYCISAKNHWSKIKNLINTSVKYYNTETIFSEELTYEDFYAKIDESIMFILSQENREIRSTEESIEILKELSLTAEDTKTLNDLKKELKSLEIKLKKKKEELKRKKKIEKTEQVEFFLSNRHVNFYDKNIKPYVLYKKLKIKYDFYYIPLNKYNAIETQINIIKNVQILELLGCNNINIQSESIENNENNIIGSINTGLINSQLGGNLKDEEKKKETRDSSYEFLERIFSKEEELLSYINLQTHIFMDENDFYSDIELKYLIRARLKSYLQSYSKTFYIKKLSSLEIKIQAKMQKLYEDFGLNFQNNNESFRESNIILDAGFFSLENISTINNIPINSIGFKIISRKFRQNICNNIFNKENSEKFSKEVGRFYEKYLKLKYDELIKSISFDETFMKFHSELLINNKEYDILIKSIDTYSDIISNYEIIRFSYKFTPLNENGFENMLYSSLYKIVNFENKNESEILIKEYYVGFLQRYMDFNNYSINILDYITKNNIILDADLINIKNFDEIKEIAYKLLIDPKNIPVDQDKDIVSDIVKVNLIEKDYNKNKIIFRRIIETNFTNIQYTNIEKFLEKYMLDIKVNLDFSNNDLLNNFKKYCNLVSKKIFLLMTIVVFYILNKAYNFVKTIEFPDVKTNLDV